MYWLYRNLTFLASPLLPVWLNQRRKKGKENAERMGERFGYTQLARPSGKLLWVHAASVGESNAALPLIEKLLNAYPALHVLLTTGTVTSAELMITRLPARAFHQFVPVDTPGAVKRFVEHWHPTVALFIDSELWPNLIMKTRARGAMMGMVNARMSESSYKSWRLMTPLIRTLLQNFSMCFAQSKEDAKRLQALGMATINHIGNLKYDVPALACDMSELERLRAEIGLRPVWLAASTHPGEERQVAEAHRILIKKLPELLTIIVPRHPERADEVLAEVTGLSVARRSLKAPIFPETDIYLADTMGELGLFYRLAKAAFIGGSLVEHGGQNPIEALHLGCPVMFGPYMDNFSTVVSTMVRDGAGIKVDDEPMLAGAVAKLLTDEDRRGQLVEAGLKHAKAHSGNLAAIVNKLQPHLAELVR